MDECFGSLMLVAVAEGQWRLVALLNFEAFLTGCGIIKKSLTCSVDCRSREEARSVCMVTGRTPVDHSGELNAV